MLENDLISGLDPSPLGNISAAQLLQMIQEAKPEVKRSFIYFSDVQPDIISNPWLIRYLWADTTTYPVTRKWFNPNTALWEPETNLPGSITGSMMADHTIGTSVIAPGADNTFLQTDSGGDVLWLPLIFPAGSIDIASLGIGLGANKSFLRIKLDGSGIEWYTFVLNDYLTIGSISPFAIQNSGIPGDVLYVQDISGNVSWSQVLDLIAANSLIVTKISPGTPDSYLRTNPAGNGVIWDATSPVNLPHGIFVDITPGIRNYIVPANVFSLDVEVVGGGGGGSTNGATGNVGGGGGGYARKIIAVTPGQTIPYEVAAGGATGNPGVVGGDSNFNTTLIATGGVGGKVAGNLISGGTHSGADLGATGWAGGSTYPGNFFPVGTIGVNQLFFYGGKSGHPLCQVDHGIVGTPSTLGCGGASSQPSIGGSAVIVATAGCPGAVIIKY